MVGRWAAATTVPACDADGSGDMVGARGGVSRTLTLFGGPILALSYL